MLIYMMTFEQYSGCYLCQTNPLLALAALQKTFARWQTSGTRRWELGLHVGADRLAETKNAWSHSFCMPFLQAVLSLVSPRQLPVLHEGRAGLMQCLEALCSVAPKGSWSERWRSRQLWHSQYPNLSSVTSVRACRRS